MKRSLVRPTRAVATLVIGAVAVSLLLLATPARGVSGGSTPAVARAGADISASAWSETEWCESRTPLDDLRATYEPSTLRQTLIAIAKRRYPPAVAVFSLTTRAVATGLRAKRCAEFGGAKMKPRALGTTHR